MSFTERLDQEGVGDAARGVVDQWRELRHGGMRINASCCRDSTTMRAMAIAIPAGATWFVALRIAERGTA